MKTKIALGSWNYIFGPYADKPISLEDALKKLSSSGYDGVELCGFKPHVHPDLYPTKESREKLKSLLAENGLGTSGFAPDFMAVPPASASAADYKKAYGQALALAKDLGMPRVFPYGTETRRRPARCRVFDTDGPLFDHAMFEQP